MEVLKKTIEKLELEIPKQILNEFTFLCNMKNVDIKEKIIELIQDSIFSSELSNF